MAKVKDFFRWWLSGDRKATERKLTSNDPTAGYQNRRYDLDDIIINELPHWNYRPARMMLWDPVVILGLLTRNAAIAPAKLEVECKDPRVREYIGRMWQTLWGKHASVLLRTKNYGFGGFQADFCRNDETQTTDLESIKEFDPLDLKVRLHEGQPVGFRVISNQSIGTNYEPGQNAPILFGPRGVLLRYNAVAGKPCGNSILRGAYSPWYSKWMPGGAVKVKQLRMMKDAYLGDIFEYPFDRSVTDPNGKEIPWRDILREVAEARRSGAAMFLPALYGTEGQKLVNYTPPQNTGDPKAIFDWVDQEDRDIWRGLGVFEEVIQASETGSGFSGRSVPMAMFLESCQEELNDVISSIDTFLFAPMVWYNFGDVKYTVRPAQLLDTWGEKMGGTSMGGQAAGGGPQAPPPGQQGDEAEPKGPQPPQQPKSGKPPTQFSEPVGEAEAAWLAPIVDYAQSDIIAARMAAAVQGAFRISAGELWGEMRRQVPAEQRKGFTGAAAALLVGGAVAAILMRKRERAQEIVEDGLFAAAIVGAGAAQEQIDFNELPSTSKAETSAPASTAAVIARQPQVVVTQPAFTPAPATESARPQLETVVVTPSAPSVPAAPPIVTPQPEPLPLPAPPQPPQGKIPSTMDTFGRRRRLRFPTEEEARKKLRGATALAGQDYRETAQFVKQDAFAITTRMSDDMVAKIRDELESNMAKGMDLRSFVRRVEAIQRGEQFPLSRARIELVFRANTARYLSDAQDASLRHPLVADQFPYRAYAATNDDRVRPTHLRLEQTGLNGTNIYRADDPAWKAFRPAWAYACRCSWRPVTVRQAARAGVVEANRWLGAAQAVANVQGGLADQYLRGTAPKQPEYVPWPTLDGQPFFPTPEWSRDGVQFSEVKDAAKQTDTNPTDAQREAGNYRKGKLRWNGLTISIETPKGASRRPEWPPLRSHYGYINSTEGVDGDQVDVFVRDNPESDVVYVIDQCDADGTFDEHKVMIGWTNQNKAKRAYLANYTDGWKCGPITAMTVGQFKSWLESRDAEKPAAESQFAQFADLQRGLFGDEFDEQPTAPKPKKKKFVNKDQGQGMLWTGLDLKPGQRDFLDEGGDDITQDTRSKSGGSTGGDFDSKHPRAPEGGVTIGGEKYDGGEFIPKRALEHLAKQDKPIGLSMLGEAVGMRPGPSSDPLKSPLNRTLVSLTDQGLIQSHDSKSGFGEPGISLTDKGREHVKKQEAGANRKFPTAKESIMAGKSFAEWQLPISQAFVNEEIDDDHPAWQSIQPDSGPSLDDYREASQLMNRKVWLVPKNKAGTVTDVSDDLKVFTVNLSDGTQYRAGKDSLDDLQAWVDHRNKRGRPVPEDAQSLLEQKAKEPEQPADAESAKPKADPTVMAWARDKFKDEDIATQFSEWFGDSKIVNADGEPLVLYHGTNSEFDEFDPKLGSEFGIYMSPKKKVATAFAGSGKVLQYHAAIKNPLFVTDKSEIAPHGMTTDIADKLRSQGYDGIVSVDRVERYPDEYPPTGPFKDISHAYEIVSFSADQIKSADRKAHNRNETNIQFREARPPEQQKKKSDDTQPSKGDGWRKVGGSSVYVQNGVILKGCPGLKGVRVSTLINESDESRAERERRQDNAEKLGLDGEDVTADEAEDLGDGDVPEVDTAAPQTPLEIWTGKVNTILDDAGYSGLASDQERNERAMRAGARPEAYAHTLISDHEAELAPKSDNDGGDGPTRMPRKGTKLYKQIAEAVGDDPQDIGYFSEVLYDVLGQQQAAASEYNDLFDDLRDNFVSDKRGRAGGFATQLANAQDPSEVPGFDEMVQYVRDNSRIRSILSTGRDESEGEDDIESRLFEALKSGKKRVPTLNDPDVWREAHDVVEATMSRASTYDPDEWDTVDFSERRERHWIHTYREYRSEFLRSEEE